MHRYLLLKTDGTWEWVLRLGIIAAEQIDEMVGGLFSIRRWDESAWMAYDPEPSSTTPRNPFRPYFQGNLLLGQMWTDEFVGLDDDFPPPPIDGGATGLGGFGLRNR